jgi:hypothetical protein
MNIHQTLNEPTPKRGKTKGVKGYRGESTLEEKHQQQAMQPLMTTPPTEEKVEGEGMRHQG